MSKRIILGMTGASGVAYGLRLLDVLDRLGHEIHVAVSPAWRRVAALELDIPDEGSPVEFLQSCHAAAKIAYFFDTAQSSPNAQTHESDNFAAPIASGSFPVDGMVVAPCSSSSLARIAAGINGHLIQPGR